MPITDVVNFQEGLKASSTPHDVAKVATKSPRPEVATARLSTVSLSAGVSGETWVSVRRPFGLHAKARLLPAACADCGRTGVAGWLATDVPYCLRCWVTWDHSMRRQAAERNVRAWNAAGDFTCSVSPWGEVARNSYITKDAGCLCDADPSARERWFGCADQLRVSCHTAVAMEFDRLMALVWRACQPLRRTEDLVGEVLVWHHDGLHANGTVELCDDGRVRWRSGRPHGAWVAEDNRTLVVTFGYSAPQMHKLRLIDDERLVLEVPERHPRSIAERPVVRLNAERRAKLEELVAQRVADPEGALLQLRHLSEGVLHGAEHLATWRQRVLDYLRTASGSGPFASTCATGSLGVSLNDINKDLGLTRRGEAASKQRLRRLGSAVVLTRDGAGQTYVQLCSDDVVAQLSSASPGSQHFMLGHLRKRLVGAVLAFLEACDREPLRGAVWATLSAALDRTVVAQRPGARLRQASCGAKLDRKVAAQQS